MKRAGVISVALLILSSSALFGQNQNRERLEAYRVAFFTQRMDLTSKEAEKFWPLFNDFQERRSKIQVERAGINRLFNQNGASMSDRELSELGDKYIGLETVETELNVLFYKSMKEILPPSKILRYYQAENQYKQLLLKELQDRRQERLNPGQRQ